MSELKEIILERLNREPSRSMNKAILLRAIGVDERNSTEFFETISRMRSEETIRTERGGQGGMVCLNEHRRPSSGTKPSDSIADESELYPKIMDILKRVLLPEMGIPKTSYVMEETAVAPSRKIFGKWSCPDISIVMVKRYEFLQRSGPILLTIEVKKSLDNIVDSVYQAKHHRRFGHYSYLYVRIPKILSERQQNDLLNLYEHCRRELVGLVTFTDADEWSTYDFKFDPFRDRAISIPNADLLDQFIIETFSVEAKFEIMRITNGCCLIE